MFLRPRARSRSLIATTALGLVAGVLALYAPSAQAVSTGLVISEVYGGSGAAPASYGNDFIELYNSGATPVDVTGWSVQYRSATGTGAPQVTPLTGTIPAGARYLVQEGSATTGTALPTPDVTGSIGMAAANGVVLLVSNTTPYPTTGNLAGVTADGLVDAVGYGSTPTTFESVNTGVALTSTTSAARALSPDTDHNANDFSEGTPTPVACGSACAPPPPASFTGTIAEIQGTGATAPREGDIATTRGVVTAVYPTGGLDGFFMQTQGTGGATDATPGASDGIFVFGAAATAAGAVIGDFVEVVGEVDEFFGLTELVPATGGVTVINGQPHTDPTPLGAALPGSDCAVGSCPDATALAAAREAHESELYAPTGPFTVTNAFSLTNGANAFMEIGLAADDDPLISPTEVSDFQTGNVAALTAYNNAHAITLDDGSSLNYNANSMGPRASGTPMPWITRSHSVRVGARATFTGPVVLDFRNSTWKLQPTAQVTDIGTGTVTFQQTRAANAAPRRVGGDLKLGTFNVLNYFNTTGEAFVANGGSCTYFNDRAGNPVTNNSCTPDGPRGAAQTEDFLRQQAKIVRALNVMDADVVSLEEIENSVRLLGETNRDDALAALVAALNADAGTTRWAFAPSPPAAELPPLDEQDVIRTAFIYDPSTVSLVGASRVLVGSAPFANAREPLAQAFKAVGTADANAFGVIVNHFKSKGAGGATGDNLDTGQGAYNGDRLRQAAALAQFADDFKAARGITKIFLTGDFNAYSEEDPVQALEAAGYTKLESDTAGEESYSFSGQSGSLDHVFVNAAGRPDVTGVDIWDINAGESLAYQYGRFNYNVTDFFDGSLPFGASDHNPELIGIETPAKARSTVTASAEPTRLKVKKDTTRIAVRVTATRGVPTGTVMAYVGGRAVATSALSAGRATLRVGPFDSVGAKRILVRYSGDANTLAGASRNLTVRVLKQRPRLEVRAPKKLERGDELKVKALLSAKALRVTGKVKVKLTGEKTKKSVVLRLKDGRAKARLGRLLRTGTYQVTVTYRGDDLNESVTKRVKIKVTR